ncbi:hypothetical protein OS189_14110 [Sulfitobacter sp. F26169L]|nr:hypothetical protein [Sulfitobacter sp. F26169L]MCX7567480.1 hypothetical protein [Sulfitobacter sp. F26169L]
MSTDSYQALTMAPDAGVVSRRGDVSEQGAQVATEVHGGGYDLR